MPPDNDETNNAGGDKESIAVADTVSSEASAAIISPRWRRLRIVVRCLLLVMSLVAAALGYVYYMSQQEPDFYQAAMCQTPDDAKIQGAELETCVMDLYNAALQFGPWQGAISQDQVNGWLASGLPAKFPELLESDIIKAPRVSFAPGVVNIAARANYRGLKGVVVASLDVFRTDQKDQFAIRIRRLRAGVIPVPIQSFAEEIERVLQRYGFATRWSVLEGDPVLTVDVPHDRLLLQELYKIEIDTIDFQDETVVVSGTTINQVELDAQMVE